MHPPGEASLESVRARFQGRFEVDSLLGKGAMAAVYKVRRDGAVFALKILLPQAQADATTCRRFELEGQILLKLDHPHIMKVFEVGTHEGCPYLLGEYLEGPALGERLDAGPLPWEEAFDHVIAILDALALAHSHDIIHRDIKPSNVLVGKDGVVKLSDFGIAKAQSMDPRQTSVGIIVGTPAYIAPEMMRNDAPSARSDLFSVGVMLYELITGQLPWNSENPSELLTMRLTVPPRPLRELLDDSPRVLDTVIEKALAVDPANRFASADEFKAELQRTRDQLKSCHWKSVTGPHRVPVPGAREAGGGTGPVRAAPPPGAWAAPGRARKPPTPPAATTGEKSLTETVVMGFLFVGALGLGIFLLTLGGEPAPEPPAPPASVAPVEELPPLPDDDVKHVEYLAGLLQRNPEDPAAAAEIEKVRERDPEEAASVLEHLHRRTTGRAQERVARGFLGLDSAIAMLPLISLLIDNPSAGNPIRGEVAATLLRIIEGAPAAENVPRTEEVRSHACQILKQIETNGRTEKPDVMLAAIRLMGWLADPAIGAECLGLMTRVPGSTGHPDTAMVSWNGEIRKALKKIDSDAARAQLEALPGPAPDAGGER